VRLRYLPALAVVRLPLASCKLAAADINILREIVGGVIG